VIYTLDPKRGSRERERGRQIEVNGKGGKAETKNCWKKGEQKVLTLSTSSQGRG